MEGSVQPWKTPTLGDLLRLAWPVVIGRAAQSVVGFTDAAFVASLGPDALAAASNGGMNALAVYMLPTGIVFIVQSFAAQLHGAGDVSALRRYAWYGLALAAAAQVMALAAIPMIPWALASLGYSPAVRALMASFLVIRLLGTGAAVGVEALSNWFAGQGQTRPGSVANVVLMALNVPLNYWWIHGGAGVPALGVRGSALASVVATWAAFALLFAGFVAQGRRSPRGVWVWGELWRVVRFGFPNGINWFLEFAAFMFVIDVAFTKLGTVPLAALMVVLQLNTVGFMPAFGVATACAIQVGNAIGARAHDAVPALVRRAVLVACGWMVFVGVLYAFFPRPLFAIFARGAGAETEAMVRVGVGLLLVSVAWQLFDAIAMTFGEALRAAGDTAWPMWVRLTIAWLFFVPVTLATVRFGGGPVATLAWVVVYLIALSALLYARFRSGRWKTIELTEAPLAPP